MAHAKVRLDELLVAQGLCDSRNKAQGLILAGHVLVDGQKVDKPGKQVSEGVSITLKEQLKYVSRGGLKLEKALQDFDVVVEGRVVLDLGASTGGFTDCVLQQGATHVYAVDVGYGQLDWRLREDERVTVMERTHAKTLTATMFDPSPSLGVVDVSFISLKKVVSVLDTCLQGERREMVCLVKPQFEYRDYCDTPGFDGVVKDPKEHQQILMALAQDVCGQLPEWQLQGVGASPIKGPKGNREFFFYFVSLSDVLEVDKGYAWLEEQVTSAVV